MAQIDRRTVTSDSCSHWLRACYHCCHHQQCKFVSVDLGWIGGMASIAYNQDGALTLDSCDLSEAGRPDSGEQQSQTNTQHVWWVLQIDE